jgi:uncharacterized OB-fold protein
MNIEELAKIKHAAPCSNRDFDFFYSGLECNVLLAQKCAACGRLRNPPSPMCGACGSFDWTPQQLSGRGTVYSYLIHHYPPLPGFDTPHPVVLAELDEGVRFIGALRSDQREAVAIGAPVTIEFVRRNGVALFQFVLALGPGHE